MATQTIVMSLELVGGTTLVLTVGAFSAAARTIWAWMSARNPLASGSRQSKPQPIAQMQGEIDPYRDAAGDSLLAQSLGITTSDLHAARGQAHTQVLSRLVDKNRISGTKEHHREHRVYTVASSMARDVEKRLVTCDEAIFLAFLAEALGISLQDLQQARESALEQGLTLAVEASSMTEEQTEDRLMRYRAQPYIDPAALLTESLDTTLEELDQRTLDQWLIERQLEWKTLTARLAAAREDALAQAVADSQLTRSQADLLLRESVWKPGLSKLTIQVPVSQLPTHGFHFLHDTEDLPN